MKSYTYHKEKFIINNKLKPTQTSSSPKKCIKKTKLCPADYGLPMSDRADVDVLGVAFENKAKEITSKSSRGAALRAVYFVLHRFG